MSIWEMEQSIMALKEKAVELEQVLVEERNRLREVLCEIIEMAESPIHSVGDTRRMVMSRRLGRIASKARAALEWKEGEDDK